MNVGNKKTIFGRNVQIDITFSGLQLNDYDKIAGVYDDIMGRDFLDIIFPSTQKVIQEYLGESSNIKHLDLACGTGLFIARLAQCFSTESYGIDLSSGQIRQARQFVKREKISANLIVGDIRRANYPTKCDLITINYDALNHIHSLADWSRIMRRASTALREGGILLFDVNTPRRLSADWNYPEVIIKPKLSYIQCAFDLEKRGDCVRRKILIQIFAQKNDSFLRSSSLIEQTAVPKECLFNMLESAGYSKIKVRQISSDIRKKHIFLKNRLFLIARK